jgi:hypothetical protein
LHGRTAFPGGGVEVEGAATAVRRAGLCRPQLAVSRLPTVARVAGCGVCRCVGRIPRVLPSVGRFDRCVRFGQNGCLSVGRGDQCEAVCSVAVCDRVRRRPDRRSGRRPDRHSGRCPVGGTTSGIRSLNRLPAADRQRSRERPTHSDEPRRRQRVESYQSRPSQSAGRRRWSGPHPEGVRARHAAKRAAILVHANVAGAGGASKETGGHPGEERPGDASGVGEKCPPMKARRALLSIAEARTSRQLRPPMAVSMVRPLRGRMRPAHAHESAGAQVTLFFDPTNRHAPAGSVMTGLRSPARPIPPVGPRRTPTPRACRTCEQRQGRW